MILRKVELQLYKLETNSFHIPDLQRFEDSLLGRLEVRTFFLLTWFLPETSVLFYRCYNDIIRDEMKIAQCVLKVYTMSETIYFRIWIQFAATDPDSDDEYPIYLGDHKLMCQTSLSSELLQLSQNSHDLPLHFLRDGMIEQLTVKGFQHIQTDPDHIPTGEQWLKQLKRLANHRKTLAGTNK